MWQAARSFPAHLCTGLILTSNLQTLVRNTDAIGASRTSALVPDSGVGCHVLPSLAPLAVWAECSCSSANTFLLVGALRCHLCWRNVGWLPGGAPGTAAVLCDGQLVTLKVLASAVRRFCVGFCFREGTYASVRCAALWICAMKRFTKESTRTRITSRDTSAEDMRDDRPMEGVLPIDIDRVEAPVTFKVTQTTELHF